MWEGMRGYQPIRVGGYGDGGRDHTSVCVCACARAWVCLCLCVCVCVCVCVYPWDGRFCDSLELQSRPCSSSCWLACSWRHLRPSTCLEMLPTAIYGREKRKHMKKILLSKGRLNDKMMCVQNVCSTGTTPKGTTFWMCTTSLSLTYRLHAVCLTEDTQGSRIVVISVCCD